MKNIFRSFEAQRPSLPSAPHRYQPSLHLTKDEITAMFPIESQQRRLSLVQEEKQRRHSVQCARQNDALILRRKKEMPYEYYGEHLLSTKLTQHRPVVLYDPAQLERVRDEELGGRHSMPAKYCY